jgi:hypothetical protein
MVRCRGTTPALSILCGSRWTCPQDSIRPWWCDGEVVSGPQRVQSPPLTFMLAEPTCCLSQWSRDMATTISITCCHEQNRRSSWLVLPETESTKGLANVIHWRPDCSAQNIVCDRYLTTTRQISDISPVNDLLPSAEEAVADIRVWTVHSDTNALAISTYFTSEQTFVYVLRPYRYSHDHPCACRRDSRTQRGHCF